MKKIGEESILQKIIPVFFLLIIIEFLVLSLNNEVSITSLVELISTILLIVIYYFLIRSEFKLASRELKENLKILIDRFDKIEDDLKEELKVLSEEIEELKKILKKK